MVPALSGTAKYGNWSTLSDRWRVYPDAVSFVRGGATYDMRDDGQPVYAQRTGKVFGRGSHPFGFCPDFMKGPPGLFPSQLLLAGGYNVVQNHARLPSFAKEPVSSLSALSFCMAAPESMERLAMATPSSMLSARRAM